MDTENLPEIECWNAADAERFLDELEERLAWQCRLEGDVIVLDRHYPIELNRIPDTRALIEWCHHLLGKVWFDASLQRRFIETVMQVKGWKLYRNV